MAYSKVHHEKAEVTADGVVKNLTVVKEVSWVSNAEKEAGEAPPEGRKILLELNYSGMTLKELAEEASRKSVIDIRGRFRDRTELHEVKAILEGMEEQPHPEMPDEGIKTTTYDVKHGVEAYFSGPKSKAERMAEMDRHADELSAEELEAMIQRLQAKMK